MLIVPAHNELFPELLIEEFANLAQAKVLNFAKQYNEKLETFFTWGKMREEIYAESCNNAVLVTELEPFYSKWPPDERLAFLRNIIRAEPPHAIVLILHSQEDLSELRAIGENNRGLIWVPTK